MSAWQCSSNHIATLTEALMEECPRVRVQGKTLGEWGAKPIFDLLARENVKSLKARYPCEPCKPVKFEGAIANTGMTSVEIIKQAHCYNYQSCEHDGWERSASRRLMLLLVDAKASRVLGWKEAPWGI